MTRKIDCGEYIHWISDVLEKRAELLLAKGGLTLSQMMVIESFRHSKDGYQTVQDIQNALHVAQPTASGLVKRMEKKGLLKRIDSKDKREKVISLTEEGHAAITNARKGMICNFYEDRNTRNCSDCNCCIVCNWTRQSTILCEEIW